MNKYLLLVLISFPAVQAAKPSLENPEELLASLSMRDRVAQLIIAAAVSNEEANRDFIKSSPYRMDKNHLEFLIKHCHVGGVIFLGGGKRSEQLARTKYYQKISDIPLLIAADAEYGTAMRLRDGFAFPENMTLGAIEDEELLRQIGYYIGLDLHQMEAHMNLAPVLDVNNNPGNPIIDKRSLGSKAWNVARKGVQIIKGLKESGIMACGKHFPGHGDTDIDSHVALPTITHPRAHLDQIELVPFKAAIKQEIDAIMIAHIAVLDLEPSPNTPATVSHNIVTKLLKEELGFEGLVITDGLGMCGATMHQQSGELEINALKAGADILLCPRDPAQAIKYILEAVEKGIITEHEINEKALRVLKAKKKAFEQANQPREIITTEQMQLLKNKLYENAITQVFDNRSRTAPETVLSVTPPSRYGAQNFGITSEQIQQLEQKRNQGIEVTIVIYGSPYAVDFFAPYASRLIVAYEDTPETRRAVEQVINGTLQPCGKLPV